MSQFKFLPYSQLQENYRELALSVMKRHGVEDAEKLPADRLRQLSLLEGTFKYLDAMPVSVMSNEEKSKIVTGAMLHVRNEIAASYSGIWAYISKKENSTLYTGIEKAITFEGKKEEAVVEAGNKVKENVSVENKVEAVTVEPAEKKDEETLKKEAEAAGLKKAEEEKAKKAAEEANKKVRRLAEIEAIALFSRLILANDLIRELKLDHMKEGVQTNDKSSATRNYFLADRSFEMHFAMDKEALKRYEDFNVSKESYDKFVNNVLDDVKNFDVNTLANSYKSHVKFSGTLLNQIKTFNQAQLKKTVEERKEENVNTVKVTM